MSSQRAAHEPLERAGGARRISACRLCGSSELVGVLDLGEQALTGVFPASADEYVPKAPLQLVWCRSCTLLQLAHSFDPARKTLCLGSAALLHQQLMQGVERDIR